MATPMRRVNEVLSNKMGDYLTNFKTWGNVMYNVLENGLVGDGVTDDTAALQTLVNTAIAAGRKAIYFPHTESGGEYYVTAISNADQVVFFGDNASFVGGYGGTIYQMGDWVTSAQLADKVTKDSIIYNVRDHGVEGDGIVSDSAAIQALIDIVSAIGGIVYFPGGTYRLTSALIVSGAVPFTIMGAGVDMVTFVRDSDSIGTVLTITESDGVTVKDISIDCKHSVYPNGNHGLSLGKCNDILIQRVNVRDWKNTAIIYVTPDDSIVRDNVIVDGCVIDGLDASNNGILLSTLRNSGIQNCQALNIGKTGSPCYGLQLKNTSIRCWITNCVATGASVGVALGQELDSVAVTEARISDISIFDCGNGVLIGYAEDCNFTGLNIDMNNTGTHAISLAFSNYNSFSGVNVQNVTTSNRVVTCTDSDDNSIEVDNFRNTNNTTVPVRFQTNSSRNYVKIKRMSGTQPVLTQALVTDTATDSSNVFEYGLQEPSASVVIASGVAVLPHSKISILEVDTEGAAATDDLTTINGGVNGQIITIGQKVNSRDVTVKHGTGNILLNGLADYALTGVADTLTLVYRSTITTWCEVGRGNNIT